MSEFCSSWAEQLLAQPVNFLAEDAPGSPIVISTRIRLARNIKGFAFPTASNAESAVETASLVKMALENSQVLGKDFLSLPIAGLNELERSILLERRLVSRELLQNDQSAVHIAADEKLAVMVNEEDHLRMQIILPGMQLLRAWEMINALDDSLSGQLDMAYDSTLGYLTSCPSNVGTGMRVSVMLHLPALALDGNIKQLERGLAKLGLTVRGMYGEGSENLGNFYQISNQSTLGESEQDIINHLARVIDQVIEHEESSRAKLLDCQRTRLLDKVGRAFGLLRYSYILASKEAFNALSGVRLGVDMKLFNSLDMAAINELFIAVSSGHLQYNAGSRLSEAERDVLRAQTVRDKLKHDNAG